MNAIGGMTGAVLNDHVSTANRGKWSIITQLSRSTWSGSALMGGLLVDRIGYRQTLLVPLGCHIAATLVLVPLVRVTKPKAPTATAAAPAASERPPDSSIPSPVATSTRLRLQNAVRGSAGEPLLAPRAANPEAPRLQ
uniref:Major facilitator superfamily (MFS) profile domain-containing protein n=1 Tax=Haptolina brevifila TaxID=156173 RepID=A0A7S2BK03_9EUKA|mmetsp:Transcript_13572/g.27298  ORF Transcript_13572/g.27298 Transcript_13572/m.27298 type:complete len:138 (+) Transcript_13572:235-648(+)